MFRLPALRDSWAKCRLGLQHPHTGEERPITFDHEVAVGRDDVVLGHLNHPLVQMSQRLLRSEVHAGIGAGKLHRFTVRSVAAKDVDGPTALAWARHQVLGGDGHRIHEELVSTAVRYRDGKTRRIDTVQEVQELAELEVRSVDPDTLDRVRRLWPQLEGAVEKALEARIRERTRNLHSIVEARTEAERKKVQEIFEELKHQIDDELSSREQITQLELFAETPDEEHRWKVDTEGLAEERARIPERLEQELDQVSRRFADPRPWTFPVAVELLVPEGWSEN